VKKTFLFILALALLMLVAIPATAGPVSAPLAMIESAMPALLTAPVKVSGMPAMQIPYFEKSPPFVARILASPLIALNSAIKPTYHFAILATLAGLMCSLVSTIAVATHLRYDIRDRMHGLPRDQDSLA